MTRDVQGPPAGGWARFAPALIANDLPRSLGFWRDVLGFRIAYERSEDDFVYLELSGAQVMLYQRCGSYETGTLDAPLGQGAMFQIQVPKIEPVINALGARNWALHEPLKDAWYRAGTVERGLRQLLVQDPDGYLLMVYEELGIRPAQRTA